MIPVSSALCPVKSDSMPAPVSVSVPVCLSGEEMEYFTKLLNRALKAIKSLTPTDPN